MPTLTTPHEKGLVLESVVAAIEAMILQASPSAQQKTHLIESRKKIDAAGVQHEIDLHVTTDIAPGYQAVFIFECKNWQEAVNKNEIIIFAEKIKACNAQHGFFVAKSFTADAGAQAQKEPRMTLRIVTEYDPASTVVPFGFHTTFTKPKHIAVHFHKWGEHTRSEMFDVSRASVVLDGKPINLIEYINPWVIEAMTTSMTTFPSGRLAAGIYERECEAERSFEEGRLVLNGTNIKDVKITIQFEITLVRPAVKSDFEINGRGRVISFEGHASGDVTINEISFTLGPTTMSDEKMYRLSLRKNP